MTVKVRTENDVPDVTSFIEKTFPGAVLLHSVSGTLGFELRDPGQENDDISAVSAYYF